LLALPHEEHNDADAPISTQPEPNELDQSFPSSLSDLKGIGCKMNWAVHIFPLFRAKGTTIGLKSGKICPRPVHFSHRFFKSDRLLALTGILEHFRVKMPAYIQSCAASIATVFPLLSNRTQPGQLLFTQARPSLRQIAPLS
jgi:hypothetical protein